MRISSIPWIQHSNDKLKNSHIYSIHAHPMGKRLATSGQDFQVKIWNLDTILDDNKEHSEHAPKLLSTLGKHEGAVLCVRWSNNEGVYLASGSDDRKIIVWKLDMNAIPGTRYLGQEEINVESYIVVKMLNGHESDVADLAWSPDNKFLASAAFDSLVIIWSTKDFTMHKRLDIHTGFVKGVVWDPAGTFLATQSDDKTLKIVRISDWTIEHELSEPFATAPSTTFFRRLTWSPEGSCIVASNGENGGLPIAPIISREGIFESSLLGHTDPVEVALFNPKLFHLPVNVTTTDGASRVSAICALGSQDNGISLYWTSVSKAPVSALNLFNSSVIDLSWTTDGYNLLACSYDGTIKILHFDSSELGIPIKSEEKYELLKSYGYKSQDNILVEDTLQLQLEHQQLQKRNVSKELAEEPMQPKIINEFRDKDEMDIAEDSQLAMNQSLSNKSCSGPATVDAEPSIEEVVLHQKISITKDGKRRITPLFVRKLGDDMTDSEPLNGDKLDGAIPVRNGKRRTMDFQKESLIRSPSANYVLPVFLHQNSPPTVLGLPNVESKLCAQVFTICEGAEICINMEANNTARNCMRFHVLLNLARISVTRNSNILWDDKLQSPVIHLAGSHKFLLAACLNSYIYIYTPAGRRYMSPLYLESPVCSLDVCHHFLMVLTSIGSVHVWNIVTKTCLLHRENIGHFLSVDQQKLLTISTALIDREGNVSITLSDDHKFTYDYTMKVWLEIGHSAQLKQMQGLEMLKSGKSAAKANRFMMQLEVSTLENHICGVRSGGEYRRAIRTYAMKLCHENAKGKVIEVLDSLCGPEAAMDSSFHEFDDIDVWDPLIYGVQKRILLKELLEIFGLAFWINSPSRKPSIPARCTKIL